MALLSVVLTGESFVCCLSFCNDIDDDDEDGANMQNVDQEDDPDPVKSFITDFSSAGSRGTVSFGTSSRLLNRMEEDQGVNRHCGDGDDEGKAKRRGSGEADGDDESAAHDAVAKVLLEVVDLLEERLFRYKINTQTV